MFSRKTGICLLIAGVLALFGAKAVQAEMRELVIGVEDLDYFPLWGFQNGEYRGAAREILDAFAADNGYVPVYRPLPVKRLVTELLSGGIDLKFPDNPQWGIKAKTGHVLAYSEPVIRFVDGVVVKPQRLGQGVGNIRVLGMVSGFAPPNWMGRLSDGQVQIKENPRTELLLRQAMLDRVDGAYTSVAVANYALVNRLASPGALVFDPTLPHIRDVYRLSSQKRPEVVAEFDIWLAANSARVQEIKQRTGAEAGTE